MSSGEQEETTSQRNIRILAEGTALECVCEAENYLHCYTAEEKIMLFVYTAHDFVKRAKVLLERQAIHGHLHE